MWHIPGNHTTFGFSLDSLNSLKSVKVIEETLKYYFYLYCYRYNSTTGTFTVPSGANGYYYFSTYIAMKFDEYGYFDLQINGARRCTAYNRGEGLSRSQSSCSVFARVNEGRWKIGISNWNVNINWTLLTLEIIKI